MMRVQVCANCREYTCDCPRIQKDGTVTGYVGLEVVPIKSNGDSQEHLEVLRSMRDGFEGHPHGQKRAAALTWAIECLDR